MSEYNFDFENDNDIEVSKERVGGGFSLLPSAITKLKLNQVYTIKSKNGALGVVMDTVTTEGTKHSETIYVTNKKGQPYYERDGKKHMLPGMVTVNNLCKLLGFASFGEVYTARKKKAAAVFDWESRKEITKEVDMLVKLCGKVTNTAMVHRKENKNKLVGSAYVPTNDAREFNTILAFLDKTDNRTADEKAENVDAKFAVDFQSKVAEWENGIDNRFKTVEVDYEEADEVDPLSSDNEDDDFL